MNMQASNSRQQPSIRNLPDWPNIFAGADASAEIGWGRGLEGLRARELSLVVHLLAAVLLLFPIFNSFMTRGPGKSDPTPIFFPGFPKEIKFQKTDGKLTGGGTGGARETDPARRGGLPIFDWLQKTPPGIPRNPNPKLPAEETVVGPPEILVSPTEQFGDPSSNQQTNSQGIGGGNGFGNRCCGGVGPGKGRGAGNGDDWGTGEAGSPHIAGQEGVSYPECAYCPLPNYSEEARKAKYQGSVTLHIVVGVDGRAADIRLVRGLGMGLDQRAIEAVRGWRFKPALGPGGKPVPTDVLIEVTFRLL